MQKSLECDTFRWTVQGGHRYLVAIIDIEHLPVSQVRQDYDYTLTISNGCLKDIFASHCIDSKPIPFGVPQPQVRGFRQGLPGM